MLQFLEAIAELKSGTNAIDSNALKATVRKTMELCNKQDNEAITKSDFIDWSVLRQSLLFKKLHFFFSLKKNHDLCEVFLPIKDCK